MNRTRVTMLILGTLSALVLAGLAVAAFSRPGALPSSALTPAGSPRPVPPPASGPPPERRSAGPVPQTSSSASAGPAGGAAAPFVQTFAAQPGVKPLPKLPSPKSRLSMPAFADGCDHAYGNRVQCVPLTFPAGTKDKCAWLKDRGFAEIAVVGADRHGLDPDGDKIACDG